MITVKCVGHIAASVGAKEVVLNSDALTPSELFEALFAMCRDANPGFSMYNTLLLVDDGAASLSAASDAKLTSGQRVVLVPFSHGG